MKVTDASTVAPQSATQPLSMTINLPALPKITTTTLPAGTEGTAYNQQIAATGLAPLTFSTTSGSLPAGLTMSSAGLIAGTPTGPTGTSNFTVQVKDGSNPAQTGTQALSIVVNLPAPPAVTTTALPAGTEGTAYSQTVTASGGLGTLTFSISAGSLPAGLTISSAGLISGTPTGPAGTSNFTVQVRDQSSPAQTGTKPLSLLINLPGVPTIAPATLPNGAVGTAYSQTLTVSSGIGPYTWSVSLGALPAGLTLAGNGTTATISGTPTTAQNNVAFTIQVADSSNPIQKGTQAYTVTIAAPQPLSVTTTSAQLPAGTVSTTYPSTTLAATGGTSPYTWLLVSPGTGPLPTGLALSGAGVITGTPTVAGVFPFTVQVTDSKNANTNANLSITIAATPLVIGTTSLPDATDNAAYSQTLQASGGTAPYTWTVTNGSSLPNWLSLNGAGTLSGTPTQTGTSSFSVTVTDSTTPTHQNKAQTLSITVVNASAACGSGNESIMKGQYAFSLIGYNSIGFLGAVASFTADGSGHITAGTVDVNGTFDTNGTGLGAQSGSITATGSSYSLGADNRGCATILTPFYTFTTRFALNTAATQGSIQEWESGTTPYIAAGQIFQQHFPATLPSGVWVYWQTGVYQLPVGHRLTIVGTKTASAGSITAGEYDSNYEGAVHNRTGLSGTYGAPDPTTGRFIVASTMSGITLHRATYLISGTQALEIMTDPITNFNTILVGYEQLQSGSLTLSGNLVSYASGMEISGAGSFTQFALLNATGSGYTGKVYEDDAGTWATPTPSTPTCSYTIDSNGRVATLGASCGTYFSNNNWSYPPVLYLTGPNTGFIMGTDPGSLRGEFEPQSATTITAGTFFVGSQEVVAQSPTTQTGYVKLTRGGGVTGTTDMTSLSSPQQANQTTTDTLTVNANGTFSTAEHPGVVTGVVVSKSRAIVVDNQKSAYPTVMLVTAVQ